MTGPPITITCECGERRAVPYGERWQCETCGRRWNTQQIPAEQYEGLLRSMRRFKFEVLASVAIAAAVFVPLIVFVNARFIYLMPAIAAVWVCIYVPFWRRKVRRAARDAPSWELRPE